MLTKMTGEARQAARRLALLSEDQKNAVLIKIADLLQDRRNAVLSANEEDVAEARAAGMADHLVDRLALTDDRLDSIISDIHRVAELPDPVGEIFDEYTPPNGLKVHKVRVPLGVIAVIYESRPNVTLDVAGLALKTGNAVILRGGSETIRTNRQLVEVIKQAMMEKDLPAGAVQLIDSPDRKYVSELLKMHQWVDMLIPRGGAALHKYCRENSTIPVITGGIGICHLFVDESADLAAAVKIAQNAKVQRPSVCNALDTLLVHKTVAGEFLPAVVDRLAKDGVTFRIDENASEVLNSYPAELVQTAGPDDFDTEWLSLVLGIKLVGDLDEAVQHITDHGTQHSDGILTRTDENAQCFISLVDSAAVYVNASTRFTDGSQLGLGAEVAISTQRLHARGPMALKELTTYKWVIMGDNHIRE
ncbi:MAG: glutamate-5-semialdehyde dehydrogenase [Deltaproteobacteria bacterium]|nr:glutamate-5-semialdehyde dehydrogenase [Deltaproteobacteria bacterium]